MAEENRGQDVMNSPEAISARIEARLEVPQATVQLVHYELPQPADNVFREERAYYLDLCLTPRARNARACYLEHWNPHRFERIGNVFLVPPQQAMKVRSDECSRQASIVCQLRPEPIGRCFDGELEWTDQRLKAGLDIHDHHIRNLLLRLAEELRQPGFASGTLVELVTAQLAIELARYCAASSEPAADGGLAPWRLRLIEERLHEVRAAPSLAELAEICRLSVRQLTRAFRASRGCSIGDHIASSQLDHAKRLLAGERSIKAIAYSLGFASPSGFCYAFRRATGQTPRQFRENAARTQH
jgi:AraC family transcriptional regulator